MKKLTGLFFGSFNPVHSGHMMLANYFQQYTDIDEIWFIVSPQNPLKKRKDLLDEYQRLELVNRAINDFPAFKVSDIEFHLNKPSYTVITLAHLKEKYPDRNFVLIMGEDNLLTFKKWFNHEQILKENKIYVYPRHNEATEKSEFESHPSVMKVAAPRIEISSSFIRKAIKASKDVRYFLPEKVFDYIDEMNLFKD